MRKIIVLMSILGFCTVPVLAAEAPAEQSASEQRANRLAEVQACADPFNASAASSANDNRAVISVQKQPANSIQKQEVKQNKWCIIIQVNGKLEQAREVKEAANENLVR